MSSQIQCTVGRELFAFRSFTEWVNKARSWFRTCRVPSCDTVCIDAKGRICRTGKQFMRARDDGAFPVRVFAVEEGA